MRCPSSEVPPEGTYLVLGASGLVGSHALGRLAGLRGRNVRAVSLSRDLAVRADNVEHVRADLRDAEQAAALMAGVDFVLLFAGVVATAPVLARDPVGPVRDQMAVTTTVCEAAFRASVSKVVFLSSTTGYPTGNGELAEHEMFEGEPPGNWTYLGWATRFLEIQARYLAERSEGRTSFVALRPTMIYGAHDNFSFDEGHFLPALLRRVVERKEPIEVWGTGEEERDLIHASDVVEASLRALRVQGFDAFNVAAGQAHSVNGILERLLELDAWPEARVEHVDGRPRSVQKRSFSAERARDRLGFEAQVSLDEGLRETLSWFRRNREEARV